MSWVVTGVTGDNVTGVGTGITGAWSCWRNPEMRIPAITSRMQRRIPPMMRGRLRPGAGAVFPPPLFFGEVGAGAGRSGFVRSFLTGGFGSTGTGVFRVPREVREPGGRVDFSSGTGDITFASGSVLPNAIPPV